MYFALPNLKTWFPGLGSGRDLKNMTVASALLHHNCWRLVGFSNHRSTR